MSLIRSCEMHYPIRVLRSSKGTNKYAPRPDQTKKGSTCITKYRYDGLYIIEKYDPYVAKKDSKGNLIQIHIFYFVRLCRQNKVDSDHIHAPVKAALTMMDIYHSSRCRKPKWWLIFCFLVGDANFILEIHHHQSTNECTCTWYLS